MFDDLRSEIAIVDYGMGNLFSVEQACQYVGLHSIITSSQREIANSNALILPGVGAFGDAMETLTHLKLVPVIKEFAASGKPLIGICLGMQLMMNESYEFGRYNGLGLVNGDVVRLKETGTQGTKTKVPQVGWNQIYTVSKRDHSDSDDSGKARWASKAFEGLRDGEFMYFNHSYCANPSDSKVVRSITKYGDLEFCSSLQLGNLFGFQFHPERSGIHGLHIYRNLAKLISSHSLKSVNV